jgi:hypothetical protein
MATVTVALALVHRPKSRRSTRKWWNQNHSTSREKFQHRHQRLQESTHLCILNRTVHHTSMLNLDTVMLPWKLSGTVHTWRQSLTGRSKTSQSQKI